MAYTAVMPSSITHHLIAKETQKRLALSLDTEYYFLGSQGGDMLFSYKPLSKKEFNFGRSLHRFAVYDFFCAMADFIGTCTGEDKQKALSYCLGYITHYSTDVSFHPFVYNFEARHKEGGLVHFQVENDWDVYFLRTREGREVEYYDYPYNAKRYIDDGIIYELFEHAATTLGRRPIKKSALSGALKNYGRYLKFFHRNCYKTERRLEKLSKALHIKTIGHLYPRATPNPAVLGGEDFFSLSNETAHDCDELFENAVAAAVRRIPLFLDALDGAPLPEEEFNYHLLTGERL